MDLAVDAGYAAGWALARHVPERAAYAGASALADGAWRRRGSGVRRLEANLRRVVGPQVAEEELRALTRAGMRSYLRYWCEVFRLPDWDRERVVGTVRCVGESYLRDAVAAGGGFVGALPHMGNWDHAGAWAALTGAPVTTVAERLRPERLYDRFVAFRERLGIEVLPLQGGEDVLRVLAARLRAGRVVVLLADRDLRATGVPVEFFGEPTRLPPGPALLALLTGAPLHPVTVAYEGRGIAVTISPPVPVPAGGGTRDKATAMTAGVAAAFERAVRSAPQDWHMLQPLWPADAPGPEARGTDVPGSGTRGRR